MTEKGKQVETVLDQFGLKHLQSRTQMFSSSGIRAACSVQRSSPYEAKIAAALPGCCEFATGIIFAGSENRTCSAANGVFCPAEVFMVPKLVQGCSIHKEKLAPEQIKRGLCFLADSSDNSTNTSSNLGCNSYASDKWKRCSSRGYSIEAKAGNVTRSRKTALSKIERAQADLDFALQVGVKIKC